MAFTITKKISERIKGSGLNMAWTDLGVKGVSGRNIFISDYMGAIIISEGEKEYVHSIGMSKVEFPKFVEKLKGVV